MCLIFLIFTNIIVIILIFFHTILLYNTKPVIKCECKTLKHFQGLKKNIYKPSAPISDNDNNSILTINQEKNTNITNKTSHQQTSQNLIIPQTPPPPYKASLIRIRRPRKVKIRRIYFKRNKTSKVQQIISQTIEVKIKRLTINRCHRHQ